MTGLYLGETEDVLLTRKEASTELLRMGIRRSPAPLAKIFSTRSDGPPCMHPVASVRSPPRHQDVGVGVGLVGVEVVDRRPGQVRLAEVGADPSHHVAGVVAEVGDAVAVFRRNDEAEVVAMLRPVLSPLSPIDGVAAAVEEPTRVPILPGAVAAEVSDMGRQRLALRRPCRGGVTPAP